MESLKEIIEKNYNVPRNPASEGISDYVLHVQKWIGSKQDRVCLIQFWYGYALRLHDAFGSDPLFCFINYACVFCL